MKTLYRQGMVKAVSVREYENEARYIEVTIKSPTDLPAGGWTNERDGRQVDEFKVSAPLDSSVRPGDIVAVTIEIVAPMEANRFQPALEASVKEEL